MMKTVLVVDDEPDILLTVRLSLELEGYRVLTALSGEEALEVISRDTPDAILLDLRLPGIDGFAVLDRIPENHNQLPVIVLSAHASPRTIDQALQMGCRDFITKPFDPEVMLEKVRAAVSEEGNAA